APSPKPEPRPQNCCGPTGPFRSCTDAWRPKPATRAAIRSRGRKNCWSRPVRHRPPAPAAVAPGFSPMDRKRRPGSWEKSMQIPDGRLIRAVEALPVDPEAATGGVLDDIIIARPGIGIEQFQLGNIGRRLAFLQWLGRYQLQALLVAPPFGA